MSDAVQNTSTSTNLERMQAFQERKMELAKQRDSRVVIVRTRDFEAILNIARAADRALNILRRNAGIRFDFDEVAKHVERFKKALIELHRATEEICRTTDTPYRAPAWLAEELGEGSADNQNG